ncbi:hypothetical protein [Desertibacillus haloalkaliphilus]|uniref:hypothetical protein n=1 Tax=Desertibacillus haloalkaliphilus TaxID=1328930 RepID=UPI001C254320|nr:hypothetical protein [Desertibacillus haloalkaliphilus]MBU8905175.1 hypothetical protein [Desertibacillus haloalkaliphilus]
MKKTWIIVIGMVSFLLAPTVLATELMEHFSLRITVVEDGTIHEWEYDSPEKYEYEVGERVIKDQRAKQEVENMAELLKISEDAEIEDMVTVLKAKRFQNLERLDVRWRNGEGDLYTWVWEP